MKQFYIYLMLLIGFTFLSGCSKDDERQPEADTTEVTLPKEAYKLQIVEAKFSQELPQEEYEGTLGTTPIKFVRADEHTLFFYIPSEITVGEIDLKIPQLNVSNRLNVKNPVLRGAAEIVLQPVFKKTTPEHQQISDSEYSDYLTTVNKAFTDYYQTLSQEEKDEMALFYQVNEDFFAEILNPDFPEAKSVKQALITSIKFTYATTLFVGGSMTLTLPGTFVEKAVIGIISVTAAVKAWDFGKQLINQVKVVTNITDDFSMDKPMPKSFGSSNLTFESDKTRGVNLYTQQRNMISADHTNAVNGLAKFFTTYEELMNFTIKVNNIVSLINDHVFFANIPMIPVSQIPASAGTTTVALTEEAFGYMNFSVADNNVKITESKFENGTIRMKLTIVNPANVTVNGINTQLNYTYQEDFSNVSGSIPIKVNLNTDHFLVGNWKLSDYNGTPADVYQSLSTCVNDSVVSGFTIYGTAIFTQNTFSSTTGKNQVYKDCTTNQPVPGLHWNNPNYSPHSGTYESNGDYQFTVTSSTPAFQTNNTISVIDNNTIIISYYYGNKKYVRQ